MRYQFTRRHEAGQKLRVSFEFFPPNNDGMAERLSHTIARLAPLNPSYR